MSDLPDNVVRLPVITYLDLDADMVLREAIGQFESCFIIGYTHDGEERFCSSIADAGTVLWLMERKKKALLEIPDTWDGETHRRPQS